MAVVPPYSVAEAAPAPALGGFPEEGVSIQLLLSVLQSPFMRVVSIKRSCLGL